jgi:hypothetical protein
MEKTSFDPIVIIGTPRSFTSLTAGIFRDHGVWFGHYRDYPEFAPTGACENHRMKKELKSRYGMCAVSGILAEKKPGWKEFIESLHRGENYSGGPHGYKHSAMFYPVWHEFKPRFICCRRSKDAVLSSGERTGMVSVRTWEEHQSAMDESGGFNVHGEEFFKGNWSELEKAFEYCGLEFNQKIAENLLNHKHKHF